MKEKISTIDWALAYHKHGWQIMPCKDKSPLLGTWDYLKDFRVKRDTIEQWWTRWPDAQIALLCGDLSGVTVVDADWIKDAEKNILREQSIDLQDSGYSTKFYWHPWQTYFSGIYGREEQQQARPSSD